MESVIRHLAYAVADGPTNMAADETLVRSAAEGVASIRFYGWTDATISLGYFQSAAVRLSDPRWVSLPWVRRPSGGATLVHHHELTYAIALPHGPPWSVSHGGWMQQMHRMITQALADLGVHSIEAVVEKPIMLGDVLCFQQHTPGDLRCLGSKVVGSAQRKHRLALMQHGSILLSQSEYAPALPGIKDLTGVTLAVPQLIDAILRVLIQETGWRAESGDWTESEKVWIRDLAAEKYGTATWNERR